MEANTKIQTTAETGAVGQNADHCRDSCHWSKWFQFLTDCYRESVISETRNLECNVYLVHVTKLKLLCGLTLQLERSIYILISELNKGSLCLPHYRRYDNLLKIN